MPMPTSPVKVTTLHGVEVLFTPGQTTKGKNPGRATLKGNYDVLSDEDIIKLFGGSDGLKKLALRTLNAQANKAFVEATTDDEGNPTEFDQETWETLVKGDTISADTLGDLQEDKEEVEAEIYKFAIATITPNAQGVIVPMSENSPEYANFMKLRQRKMDLDEAIAKKNEINRKRVEKRKENEAKKAAEAKNVTPAQAK